MPYKFPLIVPFEAELDMLKCKAGMKTKCEKCHYRPFCSKVKVIREDGATYFRPLTNEEIKKQFDAT
jgi:hypothetical protein